MPVYTVAKELAGAPRRYRMQHDGHALVVFCFETAKTAQTFAERFGGELLPVVG